MLIIVWTASSRPLIKIFQSCLNGGIENLEQQKRGGVNRFIGGSLNFIANELTGCHMMRDLIVENVGTDC